jgi:hypothetical protein
VLRSSSPCIADDRALEEIIFGSGKALNSLPAGTRQPKMLRFACRMASLVHDHFLAAMAQGLANADWAAIARVSYRNAGL